MVSSQHQQQQQQSQQSNSGTGPGFGSGLGGGIVLTGDREGGGGRGGGGDGVESVVDPENIPHGASSLAFVFDITGSMYDDLVQVIEGAAKILATTLARRDKPLYNYVLVPFHDPG